MPDVTRRLSALVANGAITWIMIGLLVILPAMLGGSWTFTLCL
jgi:hypothetical protein